MADVKHSAWRQRSPWHASLGLAHATFDHAAACDVHVRLAIRSQSHTPRCLWKRRAEACKRRPSTTLSTGAVLLDWNSPRVRDMVPGFPVEGCSIPAMLQREPPESACGLLQAQT